MDEFVRTFFENNGLWALFVLMILDNIGVPFPSEIPLLLAGLYVSEGAMSYTAAAFVSATGSLVGALVLYVLARSLGRAIVLRWGRLIRVSHDDIDRAEAWFHRRGEAAVLYLRVVPLARTIISIPAGMLEMSPARFSAYTFAGSIAWAFAVIGMGWALGDNYERVLGGFSLAQFAGAATIGSLVVIVILKRYLSSRTAAPAAPEATAEEQAPAPREP